MMDAVSLVEHIREKKIIFTVTTGRSGTAYLASIFGFAQGVVAEHEPAPEFAEVMRAVQRDPKLARSFLLEKKLPAILEKPGNIYVETSHLSCKGFLMPLLELGVVPDLIIHRRAPRAVALSLLCMGTIPSRSDKGLRFYLSPDDPGVLQINNWQQLTDYQLCYWYCLEIERRACEYSRVFQEQGARVTETTLDSLKSFSGLKTCFADLGLKMKFPSWLTRLRFLRSSKVKVNESKETKKKIALPEDLDGLEQQVHARLDGEAAESWLSSFPGRSGGDI
ncbi:MAG: hypothetical protein Q3M24_03105 [Candidatus Electrothrix aestuarii]|uniref:Sulfotransferase domain-containing protein n=1 Tax=Candidatus Electrothrix aestuarii TaxID=3062594 RepID=A0AAU8LX15_9BACT|nr:hypothetical protein [Candidatus Electrothrix aestuarii]